MDISGKLFTLLEEVKGEGKNGPWKKRNFVIETGDKYPKKVCLVAWGDQVDDIANLAMGNNVKVSFDLESREYQGKWYTDAKAWKIESDGSGAAPSNSSSKSSSYIQVDLPAAMPEEKDDLPF